MSLKNQVEFKNCLFRYRQANDKNIFALENNRLYFSTPENFNDPYDNLIYANIERIWSDVYGNLDIGMNSYLEKLKDSNPQAAFLAYEFWNGSKRDATIQMFFDQICNAVDFVKKSVRHNVKIICFSEVYDSMLMWSHYADNHKGFLLAYDINDLKNSKRFTVEEMSIDKKIRLEKVDYVTKQIDLSEDIEDYVRNHMMPTMRDIKLDKKNVPQQKLREFMLQKSEEWKYEKEWRMIPRTINLQHESKLGYVECVPKGIVLGTHCCKEDSEKIISLAKKINIPIFRMFLNEFSPRFKLDIGEEENSRIK